MEPDNYFSVKVHGEYFAQVGDKRELRGYEAVFKLPNADKPLSVIASKLLLPFLQKKDPQCLDFYTHYIDEILCHGRKLEPGEIPVRFQSKEQLREYVKFHRLSINVDDYADLGKLREHVRIAKDEPENFPKVAGEYAKKRKEENALFELNADVLMTTNKVVPVHDGGRPTTGHKTEEVLLGPGVPLVSGARKQARRPRKVAPEVSKEAEELLS